jgi:hypothetical protein
MYRVLSDDERELALSLMIRSPDLEVARIDG